MKINKSSVSRNDLKRNFLKEIIMRLDFQGVFTTEMESVLVAVKPYLKEKSFTRYEQKITNQILAEGNIPDVKSQVAHVFTAEASGFMVELSTSYIVLTVRTQSYASFEDYASIFCYIADTYRKKIDFFTVKRFGLRKINFCFVKDKAKITKYFSESYYNCEEPISDFTTKESTRSDKLFDGKHNINMNYAVEEGMLGEEIVYKITLDSDIYLSAQNDIEQAVFEETALKEINEKLFRIYINVITEDLIEVLTSDQAPSSDEILGVDDNA